MLGTVVAFYKERSFAQRAEGMEQFDVHWKKSKLSGGGGCRSIARRPLQLEEGSDWGELLEVGRQRDGRDPARALRVIIMTSAFSPPSGNAPKAFE